MQKSETISLFMWEINVCIKTGMFIYKIILNTQTKIQGLKFTGILTQKQKNHTTEKTASLRAPSNMSELLGRGSGEILRATDGLLQGNNVFQ